MIRTSVSGSFKQTDNFLRRMVTGSYLRRLDKFGEQGVIALRDATPKESGETARAWRYEIVHRRGYYSIQWMNTHIVEPGHIPVAVLIQYGHATRTGGYVHGIDYVNPALRPIFEQIAREAWREVTIA